MGAWESWTVVALMAIGTFAIRFSVVGVMHERTFKPWVERALTLVLPAMFAAIAAPMLLLADGAVRSVDNVPKVAAALVTLFVAMRWGGYLKPLIAGMAVLHGTQRLLPLLM